MEIPDSSRRSSASSGNRISSSNMNTTLFQCLWEGCPQTNPFSSMDEVYAHYRDSHVFGINSSGRDLNCKVGVKSEFESTTSPILCNVHVCSRADLLDHLASHFPLGFKPFACKVKIRYIPFYIFTEHNFVHSTVLYILDSFVKTSIGRKRLSIRMSFNIIAIYSW